MSGKNIIFTDKKIKKSNFYKLKKIFKMRDIQVDKILVSKKESYGTYESFKFFIGYSDSGDIKPLYTKLLQMIGHVKDFENNKTLLFMVIDNKVLKKYTEIWKKLIL